MSSVRKIVLRDLTFEKLKRNRGCRNGKSRCRQSQTTTDHKWFVWWMFSHPHKKEDGQSPKALLGGQWDSSVQKSFIVLFQ